MSSIDHRLKKFDDQEMRLVRTTSIMVHVPWWNTKFVQFLNSDHAEPNADRGRARKFFLETADWEDMGKPETITVIAIPGDGLNAQENG